MQFIAQTEYKFFEWSYGQTERALVMSIKPNFLSINKVTDFLKYKASFESGRIRVREDSSHSDSNASVIFCK